MNLRIAMTSIAVAFSVFLYAADSTAVPTPLDPCYCEDPTVCYPAVDCTYEGQSESHAHRLLSEGVPLAVVIALHGAFNFPSSGGACTFGGFPVCTSETFEATLDLEFVGDPGGPISSFQKNVAVGPSRGGARA